jgi:putative transposase
MEEEKQYQKSSHTKYDIRVHIVWITKYRYKIIDQNIAKRLIELFRTICKNQNLKIISGVVNSDHIHIYISLRPDISISKVAQLLKGISANTIMKEFPEIQKRYWGRHFWAKGFFVSTVGNIDEETIKNYIENHNSEDIDDDTFKINIKGS